MADAEPRRAHPRRRTGGIDLFCYRVEETHTPTPRKNLGLEILDISQGGARLRLSERTDRGDGLAVELREGASGESFRAHGVVRWSAEKRVDGGPTHVVGIQFQEIYTPAGRREHFTMGPRAARDSGAVPVENRNFLRFPVEDYVVTCLRKSTLSPHGLKRNLARKVLDLSETGAQVALIEPLEPASLVLLILHFNKFADTLEMDAEVRWCRPDPGIGGGSHLAGLVFTSLTADQRKKIGFVKKMFARRPKKGR